MCRNFSFFWKVTRDYTLFNVIQISLQFRRNFNHQVSLKSSKFSVSFFRYREQENSNFQLKYWFTLDVIPKFYHETFLRSIWIEVHRGSMDEKAEKNETWNHQSCNQFGSSWWGSVFCPHIVPAGFIFRSVQHHWKTNECCSRSDLKTLTEIKGKKLFL